MKHAAERLVMILTAALLLCGAVAAQTAASQMPDPRQVSGVPLPTADLPAGTISVRVIRGSFANNVAGVDVTFVADGRQTVEKTDASGRAQVGNLRPGSHVTAFTVVDGERLETQPVTIGQTGFRFVLASAGAPSSAAQGGTSAGRDASASAPPINAGAGGAPATAAPMASAAAAPGTPAGMPDPRQVSGVPLPASDLPSGTVSVRVIRGTFANNITGADVTFLVNGRPTTQKTDASGRAQMADIPLRSRVSAFTVIDGERLQTQEITIGQVGFRFVLAAAAAPGASGEGAAGQGASATPAVRGTVTLGPDSRIVADFSQDRLNLYYVIKITNALTSPVDLGGPLNFDLPTGARGVGILPDSSPQAKVNGPRVTVTGPFAPGVTSVGVGFELPYSGGTARIEQRWPAPLASVTVFALKSGDVDLASPQFAQKQATIEQGQPLVVGTGPAVPAGQSLVFDITGLPHHAVWPRYTALGAAGAIMAIGIWAAVVPERRRRGPQG